MAGSRGPAGCARGAAGCAGAPTCRARSPRRGAQTGRCGLGDGPRGLLARSPGLWHRRSVDLAPIVAIVLGLVAVWVLLILVFWAFRPRNVSARELWQLIPDVLRLLRSVIGDGSVPLDVRAVLVGLLLWIVSPIDLIPEFIPVLGPLDDVVVAIVALRYLRRRLGVEELRRRWVGTDDGFALLVRVIGTG